MSRGWVGIVSPTAARVSELVEEAMLGDVTSSSALDSAACSIASMRTFAPQEANWSDNFCASSALHPRLMR